LPNTFLSTALIFVILNLEDLLNNISFSSCISDIDDMSTPFLPLISKITLYSVPSAKSYATSLLADVDIKPFSM